MTSDCVSTQSLTFLHTCVDQSPQLPSWVSDICLWPLVPVLPPSLSPQHGTGNAGTRFPKSLDDRVLPQSQPSRRPCVRSEAYRSTCMASDPEMCGFLLQMLQAAVTTGGCFLQFLAWGPVAVSNSWQPVEKLRDSSGELFQPFHHFCKHRMPYIKSLSPWNIQSSFFFPDSAVS